MFNTTIGANPAKNLLNTNQPQFNGLITITNLLLIFTLMIKPLSNSSMSQSHPHTSKNTTTGVPQNKPMFNTNLKYWSGLKFMKNHQ
jgi:hypothetical protein